MLDSAIDITGKWFNKNTGKTVNVRNSVMDGDQMIIITEYGAISSEEFMRDYIQVSEDMYNEQGTKIGTQSVTEDIFINNRNQNLSPAQPKMTINLETTAFDNFNKDLSIENQQEYEKTNGKQNIIKEENSKKEYDQSIIKFFNKITSKPKIKIEIIWDDFPQDKLNTLIEYLDINQDEIISYIKDTYLQNDEELTNSIKNTFFNEHKENETS